VGGIDNECGGIIVARYWLAVLRKTAEIFTKNKAYWSGGGAFEPWNAWALFRCITKIKTFFFHLRSLL